MTMQPDTIGRAGLRFFGRMSASISHELKNVLAIIKENSGLFNDYLLMMAKGMPVDPERFKVLAGRIETQAIRADNIIKYLNRFAHTIDSFNQTVSLNESLALLTALHQRPAAMKQVSLLPRPCDADVTVTTAPFILLNLLGVALIHAIGGIPAGGTLEMGVRQIEKAAGFWFKPFNPLENHPAGVFPSEEETALLNALEAKTEVDNGCHELVIWLTRDGS